MQEELNNYSILNNYNEIKILERKKNDFIALKEKLENYFSFNIPEYIVDDILENEDYNHFCLMINLAVVNNRISNKNGEILKIGIKELYNIKGKYDKF